MGTQTWQDIRSNLMIMNVQLPADWIFKHDRIYNPTACMIMNCQRPAGHSNVAGFSIILHDN